MSDAFCWYHPLVVAAPAAAPGSPVYPPSNILYYLDAYQTCSLRGQHVCSYNEFLSVPADVLDQHIADVDDTATAYSWWTTFEGLDARIFPTSSFSSVICSSVPDIGIQASHPAFTHYTAAWLPDPVNNPLNQGLGIPTNSASFWCSNIAIAYACCGPQAVEESHGPLSA